MSKERTAYSRERSDKLYEEDERMLDSLTRGDYIKAVAPRDAQELNILQSMRPDLKETVSTYWLQNGMAPISNEEIRFSTEQMKIQERAISIPHIKAGKD